MVEFALAFPVLIVLVLGLLEFGNALGISHALTGFSREAANNASRGVPLDSVVNVTEAQGSSIALGARGGVIASRVDMEAGGPVVREQVASQGWQGRSRVADVDSLATTLEGIDLTPGNSYWVVELFYDYKPMGPFDRLYNMVAPDVIYRRSLF
jgi:hypothetical protein